MRTLLSLGTVAGALLGGSLRAQDPEIAIPVRSLTPVLPSTSATVAAAKLPGGIVDDSGDGAEVLAESHDWLVQGRFADLEARALEWTRTGARNRSGSWLLEALVAGMAPMGAKAGDPAWQTCQQLHERWRAAASQPSAVQIVAEAKFWTAYAANARGGGYADTVTPEGWKVMAERLLIAERLLRQNWALASTVPAAYTVMADVARGQEWTRAQRDELFAEGRRKFPEYYGVYFSEAMLLMPRWFGAPGELTKWAWDVTAGQPDDYRHEIYARIVWSLIRWNGNVLKDPGFDWVKVRTGFEVLRKKWPQSGHILNRYARFSWQALDRETAQRLVPLIGDAPLMVAWQKPETYESFRRWALNEVPPRAGRPGPPPMRPSTKAKAP